MFADVTRDESGRSAGWGIVEFETPQEAFHAMQTLNDTDLGEEEENNNRSKAFNGLL